MHRLNKFSEEFISKFFHLSLNKLSSEQIEAFLNKAESLLENFYFTKTSEINLLRVFENQFQLNLFISDLLKYNHYLEILLTVVSYSNYLTDILVQNPEYFYWITNSDVLNQKLDKKYYDDAIKKIDSVYSSFNSKVNSLRNFKKKEILRIGIYDYYLNYSIEEITRLLSLLANSINNYLFSLCLLETKSKFNIKHLPSYCLISLGKLGGCELNYSSDIDLILFTESNEQLRANLFSNKIYEDAVILLINTSAKLTEKGDLYRIDFRLRPFGRNAELVNTIDNYLYYYENHSEQWEKQMLIKCSFLSGNRKLFNRFYNYIQKIIYPKTFLISPIEKLKQLKLSIESNSNLEKNIKLSSGGIRDIEFSVQALQLLNGGKIPVLREKNTLSAIKKLFKNKLISDIEHKNLKSNYIFFRKIEHFMQLMNNVQTHLIPEDGEYLEKLSFILGFNEVESFKRDVNVRKEFNSNFFNQIVNPNVTQNKFNEIKFSDKRRAQLNFNYLSTGAGQLSNRKFDESTIHSFNQISDKLFDYLSKSNNPDFALDNFTKLIKSFSIPKYWFDILNDEKFLEITLSICEHSSFLFSCLLESEESKDFFISRRAFVNLKNDNFSKLSTSLFKFITALQLYVGIINSEEFKKLQTEYFLNRIHSIIEEEKLDNKYGKDLIIIGLGSFATREMNLFSDIDLVFLVNNLDKYSSAQSDCQNILNRIKAELQIEIDCRLRPEGKSSPLVWNFEDYLKYIQKRAQVWEFHTFTNSILVFGEKGFLEKIYNSIIEKISSIDDKAIKKELLDMRNKLISLSDFWLNIKKSKGGKIDLNFIIGYFALKYSIKYREILEFDIQKKIRYFKEQNDLKELFEKLSNNYLLLSKVEILYQILSNSKSVKLSNDDEHFLYLSKILNYPTEIDLYSALTNSIFETNKIFNQIFN